jgi:tetratricopeptide (TPR) repeat protein
LTRRAITSANQADEKELAGSYQAAGALREALFGNKAEAIKQASDALKISTGRDVEDEAALAFVFAGDAPQAQKLAADLDQRFPQDTTAQFSYLPEIRAAIDFDRGNAAKSIEDLKPAMPYDLATRQSNMAAMTAYVRGLAYLASQQGVAAASEFQKIIDHPGICGNSAIRTLAHLELGRAYALQAKPAQSAEADAARARARAAYQDFLGIWQNADAGIPVLEQARAELAKLQ